MAHMLHSPGVPPVIDSEQSRHVATQTIQVQASACQAASELRRGHAKQAAWRRARGAGAHSGGGVGRGVSQARQALGQVGVDQRAQLGLAQPGARSRVAPPRPALQVVAEEQRQQVRQVALGRQHRLRAHGRTTGERSCKRGSLNPNTCQL